MQSKITFNGNHKVYDEYDTFIFEENLVFMDQPKFLRFVVLELSKILTYETNYDKLKPYFRQKIIQLHYGITDTLVLCIKNSNAKGDVQNYKCSFDFSNLNRDHSIFTNQNEKVVGNIKNETPENTWKDDFIWLRSKAFSFKCGNANNKEIFLNLNQETLSLRNILIVYSQENIKRNVINIL